MNEYLKNFVPARNTRAWDVVGASVGDPTLQN